MKIETYYKFDKEGFPYIDNLQEIQPEFTPVTCTSIYEFYTLKSSVRGLSQGKEALVKRIGLNYLILERGTGFYRPRVFQEGVGANALSQYVKSKRLIFLFTKEDVEQNNRVITKLKLASYDLWVQYLKLHFDMWRLHDTYLFSPHIAGYATKLRQIQLAIKQLYLINPTTVPPTATPTTA
jgi:hypothetical protein